MEKGDAAMREIYFATVAIEKNRWTPGKIPTIQAGDFIACAEADGFDGIELWENHFLMASLEEKERIVQSGKVKIYNSYLSLAEDGGDVTPVVEAIWALKPQGVKYNFAHGGDVMEQKKRLLQFADRLPEGTRLLCECHAGTLLEDPVLAGEVFKDLDRRFGAILHLSAEPDMIARCFENYGDRICHIHAQNRVGNAYAFFDAHEERLGGAWKQMRQLGFDGTVSVEFTVDEASAQATYRNACRDLAWLRTLK